MKFLLLLPFTLMVVFAAPTRDFDWAKYDAALLAKYGKEPVEEGSGVEADEKVPVTLVAGGVNNHDIQNISVIEEKEEVEKCDNGWIRYDNSCYFIERTEKATVKKAEKICHEKRATLFVADSHKEYQSVMAQAPSLEFIWNGLYKKTDSDIGLWQAPTDFDYKKLNWLISPYNAASNGWSSIAQCAAFYNGVTKYTYWYPCDWKFLYICERNSAFQYSPVLM